MLLLASMHTLDSNNEEEGHTLECSLLHSVHGLVLVCLLRVQHQLANELLIKAPLAAPSPCKPQLQEWAWSSHAPWITNQPLWWRKKLQSVSWLGAKNILARAKQKGRKTESNNFSWSSGRLGWSTARCSLLPRSNRKSYQTQTMNNSRSASVWECWDVLASEMWNRTIAATQRRMRSLLLLPFVTQNQAPVLYIQTLSADVPEKIDQRRWKQIVGGIVAGLKKKKQPWMTHERWSYQVGVIACFTVRIQNILDAVNR